MCKTPQRRATSQRDIWLHASGVKWRLHAPGRVYKPKPYTPQGRCANHTVTRPNRHLVHRFTRLRAGVRFDLTRLKRHFFY